MFLSYPRTKGRRMNTKSAAAEVRTWTVTITNKVTGETLHTLKFEGTKGQARSYGMRNCARYNDRSFTVAAREVSS